MRRREFVAGLLGAAAAGARPLAAQAPQDRIPSVGFLRVTSALDSAHLAKAFRQGLSESGFADGQNIRIEERYADNRRDRLPGLVRELVDRNVALIATDQAVHAVKAATSTVPIVFVLGPIRSASVWCKASIVPAATLRASFSFRRNSGQSGLTYCGK